MHLWACTGGELVLAPHVFFDLFYAGQAGQDDLECAFFDEYSPYLVNCKPGRVTESGDSAPDG